MTSHWKTISGWLSRARDEQPGEVERHRETPPANYETVVQVISQRQGRRRADVLADRIVDVVREQPGIAGNALGTRLNESHILLVNEIDRLTREGRLRVDREAGTLFPGELEDLRDDAPTGGYCQPGGRMLLALCLIRLYRTFRDLPNTRIESTPRRLQLYFAKERVVEVVMPGEGAYLWVACSPQAGPEPQGPVRVCSANDLDRCLAPVLARARSMTD